MGEAKQHQVQFTEFWEGRSGLTLGIRDLLFSRRSEFQHVQVWETDVFGRLLTLDGLVMVTDRDEFVYHEMIAHPALCLLRDPRRVLVIGGGDGGAVREILRHPTIERVDLVEIDQVVIDAAREFFPAVARLDDPRLAVHVTDGVEFARSAPTGEYDVIIVDSTDPVGIAEGLFGPEFYADCGRILTERGILVGQMDSPFERFFQETIRAAFRTLRGLFPIVEMYLAFIPTYPTGMWSFTLASKRLHPVRDYDADEAEARIAGFGERLRYYNPALHLGAFALPNFVRDMQA